MNKRTKQMVGIDKYKKYDEQNKIRANYFKGCSFCDGTLEPYFLKYNVSLLIKKNKLQLINKFTKEVLIEKQINFCPYCGKKLVKFLPKYID